MKKYLIFHFLRGIAGDQREWSTQVTRENLYAKGKVENMIVFFPHGLAMRDDTAMVYIMAKENAEAFVALEHYLPVDLISFTQEQYPLKTISRTPCDFRYLDRGRSGVEFRKRRFGSFRLAG